MLFHQVVNAAPLPKVRAVSPSCVRPQHRIAAPPQPIISQAVRGPVAPTIKPAAPIHLANHSPAPFSKVRIRPPVVSANSQRPTARPTAPQNPPVIQNSHCRRLFQDSIQRLFVRNLGNFPVVWKLEIFWWWSYNVWIQHFSQFFLFDFLRF